MKRFRVSRKKEYIGSAQWNLCNVLFQALLKINHLLLLSSILRVKYCFWSCPSHKLDANPDVWWCCYTAWTLHSFLWRIYGKQKNLGLPRVSVTDHSRNFSNYFRYWASKILPLLFFGGVGSNQILTKFGVSEHVHTNITWNDKQI